MCAGHAYWVAMGWRATLFRMNVLASGGQMLYGAPEFWATAVGTLVSLAGLACSMYLTDRADTDRDSA